MALTTTSRRQLTSPWSEIHGTSELSGYCWWGTGESWVAPLGFHSKSRLRFTGSTGVLND